MSRPPSGHDVSMESVNRTRRISVVVPTFDRPQMLREALASIRARDAEYDDIDFEIIVGDNGLSEVTRRSCEDFGAIYAPAHGKGASYARNTAMRLATGEFIGFLDDDDVWLSGHVREHLAFLDTRPEYDAVFGQAIYTDLELAPISEPWPSPHPGEGDDLLRTMLGGLFPQIGTVLVRRAVVAEIGYFDPHLRGGQDLDWLLRIARRGRLGFVPVPCIHFRCRPQGTSDALQRRRIGFDRHVFLRHGLPNALRLWKTPLNFLRAYHGTMGHYYFYFIRKAALFADEGRRIEALRALATSMINLPLLAAADLVRGGELRSTIAQTLWGRRKAGRRRAGPIT